MDTDASPHQVKVRIFDQSGSPESNVIIANVTSSQWTLPDIAALDNGGFAITWRDDRTAGESGQLQILDADGNSVHGPIAFGGAAPSVDDNSHNLTKVIQLNDGTLATSYESAGTWYVQRWNDDGTRRGTAFAVSSSGVVAETSVQLTAAGNGFIATFVAADADGEGVYAQRFSSDGIAVGDPILINDTTTGDQLAPAVTELADGSVKVVWSSDHSGDSDIYQKTLILGQQVGEHAQSGAIVGQAHAADLDANSLNFSLLDDADGRFAIDAGTGVITVAGRLDYESASSHQLEVRVTDASGEFSDQLYTVGVTDRQESYNQAMSLDGSVNSHAVINTVNSFPTTDITIEMWMKPGSNAAETPLTYATNATDEVQIYLEPSLDKVKVYINGSEHTVTLADLFDGELHHYAFTWESSSGQLKTYLDGSLEDTGTLKQGHSIVSGGGLVLGQEPASQMGGYDASKTFTGEMRDVRIWDQVRSEADILGEMNNPDVSSVNLLSHYMLDGDTQDSGSAGNHLTPSNVDWITRGTDAAESIHDTNISGSNNILIGGDGADVFIWRTDDLGTAANPAEDIIRDFQVGAGGDALDLSGVLVRGQGDSIDQYLSLSFANGDSTIKIRSRSGGDILQEVKLEGVDLSGLGNTDVDIINTLISDGNLIVGQTPDSQGFQQQLKAHHASNEDQNEATVAALPNGGHIVVWIHDNSELKAQIYDAESNRVGGEFTVNNTLAGSGEFVKPSVAVLDNGSFAVSWSHFKSGSWNYSKVRFFSADGTALTDDANYAESGQYRSEIVAAGSRYALSFIDTDYIQSQHYLNYRIFDSSGTLKINKFSEFVSKWKWTDPSITGLDNGNFAVTWRDNRLNSDGARLKIFDKYGTDVHGPVSFGSLKPSVEASSHNLTKVIQLSDGTLVTSYESAGTWYVQRWNSDATRLGGAIAVSAGDSAVTAETNLQLTALDDGFIASFVAADADENGIYARLFGNDGTARGDSMLINTFTDGDQVQPAIAQQADGSVEVFWSSDSGGNWDVWQKTLTVADLANYADPDSVDLNDLLQSDGIGQFVVNAIGGTIDQEQVVNSTVSDEQTEASVAAFPDGGYIVVWISDDSGEDLVMAQRYDHAGNPEGGEFQVNLTTITPNPNGSNPEEFQSPKVAVLDNGRFAISWTYDESGPSIKEMVRFFDAHGNVLNNDQIYSQSNEEVSAFHALSANRYAITLVDTGTSPHQVKVRIFDDSGDPESDIAIASVTSSQWTQPDIIALDNGGFAITWRDDRTASDSGQLEIFDASGNSVHGPFSFGDAAPSVDDNNHNLTKVIQLNNGILATSYESAGTWYIQRWNSDGTERGTAIAISDSGVVAETNVQLMAVGDGFMATFVAADADGEGVYTQLFNGSGVAMGDPILINDTTTGDQQAPAITELAGGAIKLVWSSNHSGDSDIYQKTLTLGHQVGEHAQLGTVVGQVSATDSDGDTLTFSLINDAGGRFAIDANTGVISVAGVVDYEDSSNHELQVRVTDANGKFSEQMYVISVADRQEEAVIGGMDTGSVTEYGSTNLHAGSGTLTITDADSGDEQFFTGNYLGQYGALTLDAAGNWDYTVDHTLSAVNVLELGDSLIDTITVRSVDGTSHDIKVTIHGAGNPPVQAGAENVNEHIMAVYDFAEGSGLSQQDLTQHGHDVTFDNGVARSGNGATTTSGSGTIDPMTIGGDITIASTFTYHNFHSGARIFDLGNGPASDNIYLVSSTLGSLTAVIYDGATSLGSLSVSNFYTEGETFHVALTVDAGGHMRLYKNGVEVGDKLIGQAPEVVTRSTNLVGRGSWSATTTDGTVKDFVIVDQALDADGISSLYDLAQSDKIAHLVSADLSAVLDQEEGVNTTLISEQTDPFVAALPDGGHIVTWISNDTGQEMVMVRRYDAAGNPDGAEFHVNSSDSIGSEYFNSPSVAVLDNGNYALSWAYTRDGQWNRGKVRFFSSDGTALTDDKNYSHLSVVGYEINALGGDRYALSMMDTSTTPHQVIVRIFDASGGMESDIVVGSATNWAWTSPDIAALDNGGFAITWREDRTANDSGKLEIFDASGNSVHGPISFGGAAPSVDDNTHNLTKVIELSDGTLATSYESAGTWYVQRWNDDGTTRGAAFAVSDSGVVADTDVRLTAVGDGFLATFVANDADEEGVYTRLFDGNGIAVSDPLLINTTTSGEQVAPSVTELVDGSVQVVWNSRIAGDWDVHQKTITLGQQVSENARLGTVVGQVNATDPDGDAISYSLLDDAGGRFAIDSNTGIVTVAGDLDYESAISHQLEVRVTDAQGAFSDQLYVLGVKDHQETLVRTMSLDGSVNSYAVMNTVNSFPTTDITVELWMKPGSNTAETPLTYETSATDEVQIFLKPSLNRVGVYINGSVHNVTLPDLFDGEMHHYAFTWESSSGQVKSYLDGSLEDTGTLMQGHTIVSGGGLVLGQEADSQMGGYNASQAFTGEMRDVRIWDVVRSDAEIHSEMNNPDVSSANLLSHYKLDGDTQDSGSAGNHLTPSNVGWITQGTDAAESIHDTNSSGDNILIGGGGTDTFIWEPDDLGSAGSPAEDIVKDFQSGVGGDVLDLSDVLIGEENTALDQYLSFNFASGDSTIEIRAQAGGDVVQKVKLEGVDLSGLGNTDADIINKLVSDGNLRLDE